VLHNLSKELHDSHPEMLLILNFSKGLVVLMDDLSVWFLPKHQIKKVRSKLETDFYVL
jgi:hypothetical protein